MPDPIIQRLPDTTKAVANKYTSNPDLLSDAPTPISNALIALDIDRAAKGQNPLSARQTQLALQAAITNQQATKSPSPSLWGSIVGDIRTLASSIPRLPAAIYNEVMALPEAPGEISEALAASSPAEIISQLGQAPGIRLLPGAFTASHLFTNPSELARHPVFTALDVLPAKNIPAVKSGIGKVSKAAEPFVKPPIAALGATRPGQLFKDTFSTTARDVAQEEALHTTRLQKALDPKAPPSSDPLVNLARRATALRQKHPGITESRAAELKTLIEEDADSIRTLPPEELSFVNEYRDISDEFGEYGTSVDLLSKIDGEYYDNQSAGKILSSRRKAEIGRLFADTRESILNPVDDPGAILNSAKAILKRDDLKAVSSGRRPDKMGLLEGYAHALESAGYDASYLFSQIKAIRKKPSLFDADDLASKLDSYLPPLRTFPDGSTPAPLADTLADLTRLARTDPTSARILDAIKREDWAQAKELSQRAARRKTYPIPHIESIIDRTIANARGKRWLAKTQQWDEKSVVRAEARAEQIYRRTIPSRFRPRMEREIEQHLTGLFTGHPDFDTILPYLRERNYGWLKKEGLITEREFRKIQRDFNETWSDLKSAGYDPIFVHHVPSTRLSNLQYPRVLERPIRPSQVAKRSNDISPSINDPFIAIQHQALEWLARRGTEDFIDQILTKWARTEGDLIQQYIPAARIRAQSRPQLDVQGHANELMRQEWQPYNPFGKEGEGALVTWPAPRIKRWADEEHWVPKTVANTIQRMHNPPAGRLSAVFDPIMKVFRTSLLPLSPRWHVYNIMGGGIVTLARTDPTIFRYAKTAYQMAKAGELPEGIPSGGMGTVPREVLAWNAAASPTDKLQALFHYKGGRTMARLWNETHPIRDKFGKAVQWSYDKNSLIDDMYRSMSYLYGYDKAITKGMTKEAAEKAGIELSRKILQNWDRMTPIERSIMRYTFPFYGWMSHIMRYAFTFPFDHPYRTAVMGSFARNELEDMGDALPERFLNMFFLGDMDDKGNVASLNLAGMNPFRDVSNYFTIAGFMGQVNPVISSLLETAGLDPATGGPELFPNLRYDPETGRLAAKSDNLITNFIQATIPQSRILMGFADSSSELQELMRSNPDAAARLIRSQAGLPVLFRNINIPQEIAKAEITRDEAQSQALNQSLRTGNWSAAESFPNLRPVLDQLRTLDAQGQLEQFKPQNIDTGTGRTRGQSRIGIAQEALIRMNVP